MAFSPKALKTKDKTKRREFKISITHKIILVMVAVLLFCGWLGTMIGAIWTTLLIVVIFIPLIFLYLRDSVARPLTEIATAARSIAQGDLNVRLETPGNDEIGEIAQSFNTMGDILEHSNDELKHKIQELSIINKISKITSATLNLDEVLKLVLDDAIEVLDAKAGSIMLLNEETDELEIAKANGLSKKIIEETKVKLGDGISGWVAKQSEPLLLPGNIENLQRKGKKSNIIDAISVPLKTKDRGIGVININNKKNGSFNVDDVSLLTTLANQAAGAIQNIRLFDTLHNVYLGTIEALAETVDAKDPHTHGHSSRVALYSTEIAKEMGLAPLQVEGIRSAAHLHDIGKIGIPEQILLKSGRLTKKEYEIVKQHPLIAVKILSPIEFPWDVIAPIRQHHIRPDGKGYPKLKKGEKLSLGGKIIGIADTFDAMTSDRPHRPAFSPQEAALEIKRYAGTQFDPEIVKAFLKMFKKEFKCEVPAPPKKKAPKNLKKQEVG